MKASLPTIRGLSSNAQARVVLYQSGQLVHAPLNGVQLQPLDGDLTALAALAGTGIPRRTGTDTWSMLAYETGTWTPALQFGSSSTGIAYSGREGFFIRIGNLVYIEVRLELSNKGTATGSAEITGVPYPADGLLSTMVTNFGSGFSSVSVPPFGRVRSTSLIQLFHWTGGAHQA